MTDPHPPPLSALQEDGHLAQTSVKEDTLSRRGTSVGRANRRANSVQTHFFRFRQCGSCRRARADWPNALRPARQGGRKVENFESTSEEQRLRAERNTSRATKLCGDSHWGGDLRAREKVRERAGVAGGAHVRRISRPGDSTGEHTGQKETALWGRWGAHRERVDADA